MDEREPKLPLVMGVVVAVMLHAAFLPVMLVAFTPVTERAAVRTAKLDRPLPDSNELTIGQDESPISSVAWISHEDFQKLIAPEAQTEQPAVQQTVDPVDQAPMILDATPPAPVAQQSPTPAEATQDQQAQEQAAEVVEELAEEVPSASPQQKVLVTAPSTPDGELAQGELADEPVQGAPTQTPQEQRTPAPQPTQATVAAAQSSAARPTSAARSDSEVTPTQIDPVSIDLRRGAVITAEGIRLEPVHPRISPVARASTIPGRNPTAILTFDPDGVVRNVQMIRPTGTANWDAPIEASLYRWRASGKKLEEMSRPFTVEVTILFYKRE